LKFDNGAEFRVEEYCREINQKKNEFSAEKNNRREVRIEE
jgi:hypothetical protein